MSRDLPTGLGTALEAKRVRPIYLVELAWPSGTVYAWNGYGNLSWDSKTWVGTGHLGQISEVTESRDGAANGITLALSGVPSSLIVNALDGSVGGRRARIYFGVIGDDGTLTIDPMQVFDGIIDSTAIEDDGEKSTIFVQLEKELIDTRSRARRFTHEDQQIDFPGDLFFEYAAGMADKDIKWGVEGAPSTPSKPGSTVRTSVLT